MNPIPKYGLQYRGDDIKITARYECGEIVIRYEEERGRGGFGAWKVIPPPTATTVEREILLLKVFSETCSRWMRARLYGVRNSERPTWPLTEDLAQFEKSTGMTLAR